MMKPSNHVNNKTKRQQIARTGMLRTIEYVKYRNRTKAGIIKTKCVKDKNKTKKESEIHEESCKQVKEL